MMVFVLCKNMKSRKDMELIEVPHTHFEVMCSDLVVKSFGSLSKSFKEQKNLGISSKNL